MLKKEDQKGLSLGMKILKGLIYFLMVSTLPAAALASDPNDPTSPNYRKSLEKVVKDRWALSMMAQAGRAMQEFSETYVYYAATASYLLDEGSLTFSADYIHPLDLDTANKDPWELGDPSVTYNSPMLFNFSLGNTKVNVLSRLSYLAPVSGTSRNTSSYGMVIGTLNAIASKGRFTFIASPSLLLSYHQYETADVFGYSPNSPVSARMTGTIRGQVSRGLSATVSGFIMNSWDYNGTGRLIQGVSSNLIYQVNKDFSVLAFASWRDRVITTNSLFDDDTVQTGLGAIYMF